MTDVLGRGSKQVPYLKATPEMRVVNVIAKYAFENGIYNMLFDILKSSLVNVIPVQHPHKLHYVTCDGWCTSTYFTT